MAAAEAEAVLPPTCGSAGLVWILLKPLPLHLVLLQKLFCFLIFLLFLFVFLLQEIRLPIPRAICSRRQRVWGSSVRDLC